MLSHSAPEPTCSPSPMTCLRKAIEDIYLLQCSLVPGELLEFTEQTALWNSLLDAHALDPDREPRDEILRDDAHFRVTLAGSSAIWLDVSLPISHDDDDSDIENESE